MNKKEKQLLRCLANIRDYWLSVPKERLLGGKPVENESKERINGVIFSILALLDGCNCEYNHISLVDGYVYDGKTCINDSGDELHANWYKYEK